MIVAAFERRLRQQLDLLTRLAAALEQAGIPYRVVGGMAVFLHVEERDRWRRGPRGTWTLPSSTGIQKLTLAPNWKALGPPEPKTWLARNVGWPNRVGSPRL